MVRVLAIALTVASAVAAVPAPQNAMSFGGDVNARTLFLSSRAAIGRHGGSVGKLRSLVAKGRTRFLGADGSPSEGTVELRVLLPNRYLRIDTVARRGGSSVSMPAPSSATFATTGGRSTHRTAPWPACSIARGASSCYSSSAR
jgi:hypothetical protein